MSELTKKEFSQAAKQLADHLARYPDWDYGTGWSHQDTMIFVKMLRKLASGRLEADKLSENEIKFGTPPLDPIQRKLWEMGLKNLVNYMYQNLSFPKPEPLIYKDAEPHWDGVKRTKFVGGSIPVCPKCGRESKWYLATPDGLELYCQRCWVVKPEVQGKPIPKPICDEIKEHVEEYHNTEYFEQRKMCMKAWLCHHPDPKENKWVETPFVCGKCDCKIMRSGLKMQCPECEFVFANSEEHFEPPYVGKTRVAIRLSQLKEMVKEAEKSRDTRGVETLEYDFATEFTTEQDSGIIGVKIQVNQ